MRVLVTGGSGFIGSHVAEQMTRQGHDVTLLVRRAPIDPPRDIRWEPGDVTVPESLGVAFRGQEAVVHAAGLSDDGALAHHDLHVLGTHHVLRAALAAGVKRFVHVSSLIVHAIPPDGVLREDGPLRRAIPGWNHYARAKVVAERLVRRFARLLTVVILRPGLVLGPRDRQTTPRILAALRLPFPLVIGRGDNRIPCVVVEDVAAAAAAALSIPVHGVATYDLAGAVPITQRELLALHAAAAGLPAPRASCPVFLARAVLAPRRRFASDPYRAISHRLVLEIATADCTVDLTRVIADLGWRGDASYDAAVARAVAWERHRFGGAPRHSSDTLHPPLAAAPEAP